ARYLLCTALVRVGVHRALQGDGAAVAGDADAGEGPQADVGRERALHLRGERRVLGGPLDSAGGAARAAAAAAAVTVGRAGCEGEREDCGNCQYECFHELLLS